MTNYNTVVCFANDGDKLRYLTVSDLWECQTKPPFTFVTAQLFHNPYKDFLPFLYYFEMKPMLGTVNNISDYTEVIDSSEYDKKYWKVKIERVNGDDCSKRTDFNSDEIAYKKLIEYEASKLIGMIEQSSKSQIVSLRVAYVIYDKKGTI